jgi:hypothetical protein
MPAHDGTTDAVRRFTASMALDYERWREGTSYDLDALDRMTRDERRAVAARLTPPRDWRDVEALARLVALDDGGAAEARAALLGALRLDDNVVRLAVSRFAPGLVSDDERTRSLVRGVETAVSFGGLSDTLAQVQAFHPAPVIDALFRGLLVREGAVAVHLAAMLAFLHGRATSTFDWSMRPLFLRFHATDRAGRDDAFRALCAAIGIDGEPRLAALRADYPGDPSIAPE